MPRPQRNTESVDISVTRPQGFASLGWPVAGSYEIEHGELVCAGKHLPFGPHTFLRQAPDADGQVRWTWYEPLFTGEPDLDLAKTEPTEEGVRAIAKRYGFLGAATAYGAYGRGDTERIWDPLDSGEDPIHYENHSLPEEKRRRAVSLRFADCGVEPFEFWRYQITKLQALCRARDLVSAEDSPGLRKLLEFAPELPHGPLRIAILTQPKPWRAFHSTDWSAILPELPEGYAWTVDGTASGVRPVISPYLPRLDPTSMWHFQNFDHLSKPPEFLLREGARWISETVTAMLRLYAPVEFRYSHVKEIRETAERQPDVGLIFAPNCLLGAVYAKFADELSGKLGERRRCPACGFYFTVHRADRITCSDSCRQARCRELRKTRQQGG